MSKTIWKYPLKQVGVIINLEMPKDAKLLTVQLQGQMPTLWALCDEYGDYDETRAIILIGTGQTIGIKLGDYLGTVQTATGLVWHAFEVV